MMKSLFTLATILACGSLAAVSSALANDTSIAKIDVRKIESGLQTGSKIVFSGLDAKKFFELLPPVATSVPSENPKLARELRHMFVIEKDGDRLISISCTKVKYDDKGRKRSIPTECTISLDAMADHQEDITDSFTPACRYKP